MTISNAWRLHILSHDDHMDQLLRRNLARYDLRQTSRTKRRPGSSTVQVEAQDGLAYYPQKIEEQLRCIVCHARACWLAKYV